MKTQLAQDEVLADPIVAFEGDTGLVYAIRVPGVISGITGVATMTFHKVGSGSDLSATYLTGSTSISGTDIVITKTFQNLKAGFWIWSVVATVDGRTYTIHRQPMIVKRANEL